MKILVLHNAYRQRGGEDAVVEAEIALLRRAGHEVHLHQVSNQQIEGVGARFGALARVAHNRHTARQVADLVRETQAQIVHVHNFVPLLSPAVHGAARQAGAAVVQTLHNYRLLCAMRFLASVILACVASGRNCMKWGPMPPVRQIA